MINKEKLRSMINHHFGNVDNKENFINELFDNCNLLISGRLMRFYSIDKSSVGISLEMQTGWCFT